MAVPRSMVSACLAGIKCRYDGQDRKAEEVVQQVKGGRGLPICPEQLGGLSTPRKPSQIIFERGRKSVICSTGEDVTRMFLRGAFLSWRIANRFGINSACLKKGSPSCGSGFKNKKVCIAGMTFALLDNKKWMKISSR